MAKLQILWFGTDTFGRQVEVAESDSGNFFARTYEYNGYGKSWGRWETHTPTFETTTTNAYSEEVIEHKDNPIMTWGFNRLTKSIEDLPKYRLPNAA